MTQPATGTDKQADLAGPGIGNYEDLEKVLPTDYAPLLDPRETQAALFAAKRYIEENLCRELNLMMVTVPLIVAVPPKPPSRICRKKTIAPAPAPPAREWIWICKRFVNCCKPAVVGEV